MLESHRKIDRFEDRMMGILPEHQILEHDAWGAAHRIIEKEDPTDFFHNPEKYLRSSDLIKPNFCKFVKENVRAVLATDIDSHVLFKHLKKGQVSPLVEEALWWDIQAQLAFEAAQAIFKTNEMLCNLPAEAHEILFRIFYEKYSRGEATMIGICTSLLAQETNKIKPEDAATAGYLCNLGKLEPKIYSLVKNPERFTEDEYKRTKFHSEYGARMWQKLKKYFPFDESKHELIINGMMDHHERLDGKGYPEGKKDPSLIGRIIAIAESYIAMISHRKHACKIEDAIRYAQNELKRCSGMPYDHDPALRNDNEVFYARGSEGQFDSELVKPFLEINPIPTFRKPPVIPEPN